MFENQSKSYVVRFDGVMTQNLENLRENTVLPGHDEERFDSCKAMNYSVCSELFLRVSICES